MTESARQLSARLESRIDLVDGAEESVREFARKIGFNENDQYFIGLALREILINAMKHGNRFDPGKMVELHLREEAGDLVIDVMDEGEGFRLSDVPDPTAPENILRKSGRGVMMAVAMMDGFLVERRSPSGTHIQLRKHLNGSGPAGGNR